VYIVQEPVVPGGGEDEQGAAGGRDLRQGVAALMDVMRDLLNSVRFVPPPVENHDNDNDSGDDDDADWN
jgi:hypothetical protein